MIRTTLALLPAGWPARAALHLAGTALSVALRACGAVVLIPLVAALFSPRPAGAWPWLGVLAALTFAGWALDGALARSGFDIGFALLENGQRSLAERISRIRLDWLASHTAEVRTAVAATGPDMVGLVSYLLTPLAAALLLPVFIGIALLWVSVPLAAVALAGVPVILGAFWASGRITRAAARHAEENNAALSEGVVEFARTQEALRAALRADGARGHLATALRARHSSTLKLIAMQVPGQLLLTLATQLVLLALAGTAAALTLAGEISAAQAAAFVVVIVRYIEPLASLSALGGGLEVGAAMLRRIASVLSAPTILAASTPTSATPAQGTTSSAAPVGAVAPRVELRGVTFGYPVAGAAPQTDTGSNILTDFNLTLQPGSVTAIVGPSGSGKTTLLSLLAGLHTPQSGAILLDGVPESPPALNALASVVFQEPYLFEGSLRDNILVGYPQADESELRRVSELTRVSELAQQCATSQLQGWDRPVGEGGQLLSGGERQRVSIARALLKPAPLLLIDEATSALDALNEAAMVAALTADPLPRTRVIVAHRLSTIAACDWIVFLEGGRVMEEGTATELLARGGRFARFWQRQSEAATWRVRENLKATPG